MKPHRSMIIDHLIRESDQTNYAVAYVYIRGEDMNMRHSTSQVVSMLIKQLCWRLETLPEGVLESYRKCKRDARFPVLDKLTAIFTECVRCLSRVFVILDGLDEFEERSRKPLLNFICTAARLSNEKVLVTSRWDWDIERAFRRVTSLILPNITSEQSDIEKVVTYRVIKDLGHIERGFQEEIIKVLVERSGGM